MSERFLLTGGSGFIGSALVRRLIRDGKTVTNLDALTYAATPEALAEIAEHPRYGFVRGSITDKRRVRSVLRDSHPTVVVNLAAESHVDRSIDEPSIFVSTNVLGTTTLLEETTEYWRGLDPGSRNSFRFVHVSTDEVFGSIDTGLFDDSSPYDPSSPYAASKAAGDHMVRAWHRTYGLPALITNCANNYGPYQFPEKLIPLMIVRALAGKSLPVYGDGGNVRDWIHVDDHVSGLLLAADRGRPGDTYLLGSRSPVTNLELVLAICQILDEKIPSDSGSYADRIEMVKDRPGHDRRYALDPTSSEEILGFKSTWGLAKGLANTVDWYLAHRAWWESILADRYRAERLGVL